MFKILGTDMTNKTNFSVLNMPSDTCDINLKPVVLPKSLAGRFVVLPKFLVGRFVVLPKFLVGRFD